MHKPWTPEENARFFAIGASTPWQSMSNMPNGQYILLWNAREDYPIVHMFTEGEAIAARKNPDLFYSHWAGITQPTKSPDHA